MTHEAVPPTSVNEIEDVLLGVLKLVYSYESWELRANLLYWAGRATDSGEKFFIKRGDKNVSLLFGEDEASARNAFTIGIGETALFFDSRTAIPGYMVYKSRPLSGLEDETAEQAIFDFIRVRPTLEEIIDIRPETLKQKMVERKEKTVQIPESLLKGKRKLHIP